MNAKLRWFGWSFGVFVLLLGGSLFFLDQIDSIVWHLSHRNRLAFDHYTLALPYFWHPSPEVSDGGVSIWNANNPAQLRIEKDRLQGFLASDQDGRIWQKRYETANSLFKNPENRFVRSDFRSKAGLWVCVEQNGMYSSFLCKLVGTDLVAKFMGKPKLVNDAKSILTTLE